MLLAAAALVAALLWPRWERHAFQERVDETTRAVDAAREALTTVHRARGLWPSEAAPGRMPPELDGTAVGGEEALHAGEALLQVRRWTLLAPPGTLPDERSAEGTPGRPGTPGKPSATGDAGEGTRPGAPSGQGPGEDGESELPAEEAHQDDGADEEPEEAATSPPRAVQLAGITVHAAEPALLAALLRTYGREDSFVRDTTWTLILSPAGVSPDPDDGRS
jgi:hypothetical protein